jgi:hypothetical protein
MNLRRFLEEKRNGKKFDKKEEFYFFEWLEEEKFQDFREYNELMEELVDESWLIEMIKMKKEVYIERMKENKKGISTHLMCRTLFAFREPDGFSGKEIALYELENKEDVKAYGVLQKENPDLFLGNGSITLVGKTANVTQCFYRDVWSTYVEDSGMLEVAYQNQIEAEVDSIAEAVELNERGHCEVFSVDGWAEQPICLVDKYAILTKKEKEVIEILKEEGVKVLFTSSKEVKELASMDFVDAETWLSSFEAELELREEELAGLIPTNCGISLWD